MPFEEFEKLGPLQALAGTWEGSGGVDFSFHHDEGATGTTEYRERITFSPFGPVDNGDQCLYGLDYRMAAWRDDEQDPFHTEVGYWLWCADSGEVVRAFMVPRGAVLLAGGHAEADATEFTMTAELGSQTYGILENKYLAKNASTVGYTVTVKVDGDTLTYDEDSILQMKEFDEPFHHTDRNVLHRVPE